MTANRATLNLLTLLLATMVVISGCDWLKPKRSDNPSVIAELSTAHGFIIVDTTQSRTGAHMIVQNISNGQVQVRLTPKGEELLSASEQGAIGLNGQKTVTFSQAEFSAMLNKLHACLEAKGGMQE